MPVRGPAELAWSVLVHASGGWMVLARFCDEAAAWTYAKTQLEARVRNKGECIAHKCGYGEPWIDCDHKGPCAPAPECWRCDAGDPRDNGGGHYYGPCPSGPRARPQHAPHSHLHNQPAPVPRVERRPRLACRDDSTAMTHTMATLVLYQNKEVGILIHARFEGGLIGREERNARSVLLIDTAGLKIRISDPSLAALIPEMSNPPLGNDHSKRRAHTAFTIRDRAKIIRLANLCHANGLAEEVVASIAQWAVDEKKRRSRKGAQDAATLAGVVGLTNLGPAPDESALMEDRFDLAPPEDQLSDRDTEKNDPIGWVKRLEDKLRCDECGACDCDRVDKFSGVQCTAFPIPGER